MTPGWHCVAITTFNPHAMQWVWFHLITVRVGDFLAVLLTMLICFYCAMQLMLVSLMVLSFVDQELQTWDRYEAQNY